MKLIARWTERQDAATERPCSIRWENGTPATIRDFASHQLDTHTTVQDSAGRVEQHFYPNILATVVWDAFAKDWVVNAPDTQTFALDVSNQDAGDDEIIAAIYTFPTVYRANIIRSQEYPTRKEDCR